MPYIWVHRADEEERPIGLSHVHLPKLGDAGLVEWRPGEQIVELGERADRLLRGLLGDSMSRIETENDVRRAADGAPRRRANANESTQSEPVTVRFSAPPVGRRADDGR